MTYRLIIAPEAFDKWERHVDYIATDQLAPLTAERWLKKSWTALQTLKRFPHRCPSAPESSLYPHTIRMLLVDNCLFLFRVDEDARVVRVLGFRHAAQLPFPLDMHEA